MTTIIEIKPGVTAGKFWNVPALSLCFSSKIRRSVPQGLPVEPPSAYFSLVNRALLLLVGAWLFSTSFAQAVPPSDQAARETAVRWLALLDSGAFRQAYSERPPHVNRYGYEEEFVSWMRARRAPLGRPKSREFFRVTHRPDGNYEFIIFKTSFEHKAQVEAVTLTSEAGRWQVSGYAIALGLTNRWSEAPHGSHWLD